MILFTTLALLLLPCVAADQTVNLIYDLRDLPARDTQEIPVIDLEEGDEINVNTSSAWIEPRKKIFTADEFGDAKVILDIYIPHDAKEGDYTEKVVMWTYNTRSVVTFKIKLARTVKRSDLTVEVLELYSDEEVPNATVVVYSEENMTGRTDMNGLFLVENVKEGCWDISVKKKGYKARTSFTCLAGINHEVTYYLVDENKTNITKTEEMLAYHNFLTEHEERLRSMNQYADSFIMEAEDNKTCPRQADFDNVSNSLKSCSKELSIAWGIANITTSQNLDVDRSMTKTNKRYAWALGILIAIASVLGISYLAKKKGLFGAGGFV